MNIKEGPLLRRYAIIHDIPINEVIDFVKGYVNDPAKAGYEQFEETEAERFAEMKRFIELCINTSTTGKIENAIRNDLP